MTHPSQDDETPPDRSDRVLRIGVIVAVLWLVLSGLGLWLTGPEGSWLGRIIGVVFPLLLIGFAVQTARASDQLRDEARALRQELNALRNPAPARDPAPAAQQPLPETTVVKNPRPIASPPAAAPRPVPVAAPRANPQASLQLAQVASTPPLPHIDLVRALHFPEDPEDTEGFRALRRALKDHNAGQLIQAAQDVLTLLSQDGIYMDDLTLDPARPDIWRRFAQGERGVATGAVGGIRDRTALDRCATRMREDAVFRDAVHHFLRRFDNMLAEVEPEMDNDMLSYLGETRTARAFMLLGRVSGVFA